MALRLNQEELDVLLAGRRGEKSRPKKKSKYHNRAVMLDGKWFHSEKEGRRYLDLKLARKTGDAIRYLRQVPFELPGGVKYFLDFLVFWRDGRVSFEDVKGYKTQTYKIKKKQVEKIYKIKIEELS